MTSRWLRPIEVELHPVELIAKPIQANLLVTDSITMKTLLSTALRMCGIRIIDEDDEFNDSSSNSRRCKEYFWKIDFI